MRASRTGTKSRKFPMTSRGPETKRIVRMPAMRRPSEFWEDSWVLGKRSAPAIKIV
jgi:hypothetical protein